MKKVLNRWILSKFGEFFAERHADEKKLCNFARDARQGGEREDGRGIWERDMGRGDMGRIGLRVVIRNKSENPDG